MPTPSERKALLFLSTVLALGVGVRVARTVRRPPPPAEDVRALTRQLAAVDSARAAARERGKGSRERRGRRGRPPGDSVLVSEQPTAPSPQHPVDVDVATARQLEALPRVGPALARRIVASRDSAGPFGSLEALQRVRGVGPKLAGTLRDIVTFSGTARPASEPRPWQPIP